MSVTTEVLRRARRGDERAFAEVVDAYGRLVLNLAFRMSRDRQEAEDLAQEVFLRVYRAFSRYDPDRPFTPWLRRVATNLLINLTSGVKRRNRRQTASLDSFKDAAGELPEDPDAPEGPGGALRSERARRLNRAILDLKPEHRAIVALHYYEGRSYEQIAEDLSLPLGIVAAVFLLALAIAIFLGLTAVADLLGRRIYGHGPRGNTVGAFTLGWLVLSGITLLPIVGFLAHLWFAAKGVGAVVLSLGGEKA